jgi:hypothetical protein
MRGRSYVNVWVVFWLVMGKLVSEIRTEGTGAHALADHDRIVIVHSFGSHHCDVSNEPVFQ